MAQTTTSYSARNSVIEVSTDNASWTNISGSSNSITPGDGSRLVGSAHTFDGDGPVITVGKLDVQESTISILYTETAGEAYETARAVFASTTNNVLYVRSTPLGATTGNYRHTTGKGVISSFAQFADIEASSGDPMMLEFTVTHPGWTKSAVP
jgi:hypothetical protein